MSAENADREAHEGSGEDPMIVRNLLKKVGIFLLTLVFFHTAVAAAKAGENLAQLLTRIAPEGWQLELPVKRFVPKNLWKQIDGRAEFFLSYGMVHMTFAVFADPSNPESFIDVSIYNMENPTSAFGVFSAERHKDIIPFHMGREAYRAGGSLYIWIGQHYVRMIASDDNPQLQKISRELAEKLTASLHDSGEPVWGLDILPVINRVPGSEKYFRRDAMGLDFMENTYTARYRKKGVLITVFLSRRNTPTAAGEILNRYAAYARQFGEGHKEITRNGVTISLCNMDGSYDALFYKGDVVAGVTSVENRELALDSAFELWRNLMILY
jgi:hypothetical protein